MSGQNSGPRDLERLIVARALKDPQFRNQLLEDPTGIIETALGIQLPAGVTVNVVEQEANTLWLVLPPRSDQGGEAADELSEAELAGVAGGGGSGGCASE